MTSGAIAASLATSGVATARNEISDTGGAENLRLRGHASQPLGTREINKRKKDILEDQDLIDDVGIVNVTAPEKSEIVAYNFDIINGSVYEWCGSVGQSQNLEEKVSNLSTEKVAEMKRKADDKAEEVIKYEKQDIGINDSPGNIEDDWDRLSTFEDEWTSSERDNAVGYEWAASENPEDDSKIGVVNDLWARPDQESRWGGRNWRVRNAELDVNFIQQGLEDHGPSSTVGTSNDYWEIGTDSDSVIEVAYGSSSTSSDYTIDNKTDPRVFHVQHEYDFGSSINRDYIEFNNGGVTSGPFVGETARCPVSVRFSKKYSSSEEYYNKAIKYEK